MAQSGTNATVTCPAYSWDESKYGWLHCSHAFDRNLNETAYQNGREVGWVNQRKTNGNGDIAWIENKTGNNIGWKLDMAKNSKDSYMGWDITGVTSESTLEYYAYYGSEVSQQGITGGRREDEEVICLEDRPFADNVGIVSDHWSDGGDSGGPIYDRDGNNDILILGTHTAGGAEDDCEPDDGDHDSFAQAAYWAESEFNITI